LIILVFINMAHVVGKNTGLFEKVYKVVQTIPVGSVMTYGQIARALGIRDVRKVGWALHANPDGKVTPCHRVVKKDGGLAPGYAFGGPNEQRNKLLAEGVKFIDENYVDLKSSAMD
jgi:methylated-DNA-protein-cysteine methyltransferase related protein